MRKLMILLLFLIVPILLFGQKTWETDSIVVADLTGVDTTVFVRFYSYGDYSIQFDYSNFDADDATISLGNSNDGTSFDKIDDARVPYTLDVTTNDYVDEAGATRATVTFEGDAWRTIYLGIKLTIGSVTTRSIIYKYARQ